jgi:GAF domain-containing protein
VINVVDAHAYLVGLPSPEGELLTMKRWFGAKAVQLEEFETQQSKLAKMSREVFDRYQATLKQEVADPARLEAVYGSAFANADSKRQAQVVALMASSMLSVPNAMITLILPDRQVRVANVVNGQVDTDLADDKIEESFCKHVIGTGRELAIDRSGEHALVCDTRFARSGEITSYLGVPIANTEGIIVGVLCVFDSAERDWGVGDVGLLTQLSVVLTRALGSLNA